MSELCLFVGTLAPQPGEVIAGIEDIHRKVLVRTGGVFPADHPLNINEAGEGWVESGVDLTFMDTQEFLDYAHTYRNGQLIYVAEAGSAEAADAYVEVLSANVFISFSHPVAKNDSIIIWKFAKASI